MIYNSAHKKIELLDLRRKINEDKFSVEEVLDVEYLNNILDDIFYLTHCSFRLVNPSGKVLICRGEEDICPEMSLKPEDLDKEVVRRFQAPDKHGVEYDEYHCGCGARYFRYPINTIKGLIGYLIMGQFFYHEDIELLSSKMENNVFGNIPADELKKYIYSQKEITHIGKVCSHLCYYISKQADVHFHLMNEIMEHKNTAQELRVQKSYFQNLFEKSPDALVLLDNQDRVLGINSEFEALFGYSSEEAVGHFINDLIVPEDLKSEGIKATHAVAEGERIDFSSVRVTKDGKVIHVNISGKPITLGDDQLAVYGIYRDITKQVIADRNQRIMHRISRSMVSSWKELFSHLWDELQSVVKNGEMFVEIYDPIHNRFNIPVTDDADTEEFHFIDQHKTLSLSVIENGKTIQLGADQIQEQLRYAELDRCPKFWMGIPLMDGDRIFGVFGIQSFNEKIVMTSETRKLLEFISVHVASAINKKRRDQELRKLYRSLEQSPVSVIITDLSGDIEYVNPRFSEVTGYAGHEVVGRNPRILQSGRTPQSTYFQLWENIRNGKVWIGEFLNRKKNGDYFWEEASIAPVKNDSGRITHIIAVKEDITQKKKIEQDLINAKEQAEESDQLKTAFLANISHELRTPLNAVIGFSNLCNELHSKEELLTYMNLINQSGNHLLRIIDDVLNISLMESGQIKLEKKLFNLERFMSEIQGVAIENRTVASKDHLKLKYSPDLRFGSISINSDPLRLKQVLMNLLKNAFKFTEQGWVEYGYAVDDESVKFFIKDTGVGIETDQLSFIFDRFRQVDDSLTRRYEGAGLGLTISKKLVDMWGGTIEVESEPGVGSCFMFTIPGVVSKETSVDKQKNSSENSKHYTILVVEDELSNYKLVNALLQQIGIDVIRAKNGKEACVWVKNNGDIDLVLMDMKMPVMDGQKATPCIKEQRPTLPVIALTAYAMDGDREKALDAGCDAYLSKPLRKKELFHVLSQFLDIPEK